MSSSIANNKLIAIDPSLTCTGWALFTDLNVDSAAGKLMAVGKIKSLSARYSLASRYKDLQEKITNIFSQLQLSNNDVLICEAPTTMRDPRAAFKVEQVRGIFETVARQRGLFVPGRINPRTVQSQIMGLKGQQLERSVIKHTASTVVQSLFRSELEEMGFEVTLKNLMSNQDIVDAILVGAMALTKLQALAYGGLDLADGFPKKEGRRGKRCVR